MQSHRTIAIPTQLDHGALEVEVIDRPLQPWARSGGMKQEIKGFAIGFLRRTRHTPGEGF